MMNFGFALKEAVYDIFNIEITVLNSAGLCLTGVLPESLRREPADFLSSDAEIIIINGNEAIAKIPSARKPKYILHAACAFPEFKKIVKAARHFYYAALRAKHAFFNRNLFFKRLLFADIKPFDIYGRAEKLRVKINAARAVYIIEMNFGRIRAAEDVLRNMFPNKDRDFLITLSSTAAALIKELKSARAAEDAQNFAGVIYDTVLAEAQTNIYIARGGVVNDIKDIPVSFKQAKTALEAGRIFFPEKSVINHDRLGLGRLIYHTPVEVCEAFLTDALNGADLTLIDGETASLAGKLFENNLNITETARQLYMHRNTLIYKLDKLQKATGLDLRKFNDAAAFKTALMVINFLRFKSTR